MQAPVQLASALAQEPPDNRWRPGQTDVVVELRDITVTYRDHGKSVAALAGLSLRVAKNERVALIGPSGCGKSTLLEVVTGLAKPESGSVRVDGDVGLMPQRDLLVPWRNALRNAALALEAQGVPRAQARTRAEPLFERFGLASFERSMPWQLSGGMRQRVAFLRTVLTGRRILALDEPFGALDSITRAEMQEWLIAALDGDPCTLLLVTHDVDEALVLADRVVVLSPRPGRVTAELKIDRPPGAGRREWVTSREFTELKATTMDELA